MNNINLETKNIKKIHYFLLFSFFLLCLLSSSIIGFPFLVLEGCKDEAVVSAKSLRVEFHYTHTNHGWWCTISVQTFH